MTRLPGRPPSAHAAAMPSERQRIRERGALSGERAWRVTLACVLLLASGPAPAGAVVSGVHGATDFLRTGPFARLRSIGDAAEVVTLRNQNFTTPGSFPGATSTLELLDSPGAGTALAQTGSLLVPDELGGDFQLDAARGDLDGDGIEELVFASERGDGTLRLIVIGGPFLDGDPTVRFSMDLPLAAPAPADPVLVPFMPDPSPFPDVRSKRVLKLATGQLDADAADELVVAYWASDDTIEIVVLDGFASLAGNALGVGKLLARETSAPREGDHAVGPVMVEGGPEPEEANINQVAADVVELLQSRAQDRG